MILPGDVSAVAGAGAGGVGPYLTTFPQHVTPNESLTVAAGTVLGTSHPTTTMETPTPTTMATPTTIALTPHPQEGTEYILNAEAIQSAKEEMSQLLQQQTTEKEQVEEAEEQFQLAK